MKIKSKSTGIMSLLVVMTILFATMVSGAWADESKKVTLFAAASTTNAFTDIIKIYSDKKMGEVTTSFASSSTLAKQIEQGAPADVYISADLKWMDYLASKKLIEEGTRSNMLGNRIVLIAPADSEVKVKIEKGFNLSALLGDEKLAMGDPDHVPAGIYGKQALETLGAWEAVASKVARAKDVRAALALVAQKEAPFGIVYATDAAISDKVKIIGTFPEDSHPPITYPVCIVAGKATPEAKQFLGFMQSPEAKAVFEKYGFSVK